MQALTLMACPHDSIHKRRGWYGLAQYLTAHTERTIRFEMSLDFAGFHRGMRAADLVYANPNDGLHLIDEQHYSPLSRPANMYDEALIVTGAGGPLPAVEAIHGSAIASVSDLLPTKLALKWLRECGVTPASVAHRDSWLSVVRSVWNGEAPFGVIYRDAYQKLSDQGRAMVRILKVIDERSAFHTLLARPAVGDDMRVITQAMSHMQADAEGQAVLSALQMSGWLMVIDEDIARMRAVLAG